MTNYLVHSFILNFIPNSLKSAKAPDEAADMGKQTFSYALRPHIGKSLLLFISIKFGFSSLIEPLSITCTFYIIYEGTLQSDGVIQDSYEFNCPLRTFNLPNVMVSDQKQSYIEVTGDQAIVLETVKMVCSLYQKCLWD